MNDEGRKVLAWDANIDLLTYSTPCFVADTMVAVKGGQKKIVEIKEGDEVLTTDGYRRVEKFFDNGIRKTFKTTISFAENTKVEFEATPSHKFKTTEGWVELKDLKYNDVLYGNIQDDNEEHIGVQMLRIKEIRREESENHVYDIQVEEMHEFFANNILVHNCTDISSAGLQKGFNPNAGTRSSVLWDTLKCIHVMKPKYLLQENVKAIVSQKFLPMFNAWQLAVEKMGYRNYTEVLNAKDYGVPQNRERLFMLSVRDDLDLKYKFPTPFPLMRRLEDVLEKEVDEKYYIAQEKTDEWIEKERTRLEAEGLI